MACLLAFDEWVAAGTELTVLYKVVCGRMWSLRHKKDIKGGLYIFMRIVMFKGSWL